MSKILGAGNLVVYINSRPFGIVHSWALNDSTPSQELGGVDTPDVVELAPTVERVGGTMGVWRLAGDGGTEGAGLKPHSLQLARGRYFSMLVIDRVTKTVFFQADRCRVESAAWQVVVKDLVRGTISWKAIRFNNEIPNTGTIRR